MERMWNKITKNQSLKEFYLNYVHHTCYYAFKKRARSVIESPSLSTEFSPCQPKREKEEGKEKKETFPFSPLLSP